MEITSVLHRPQMLPIAYPLGRYHLHIVWMLPSKSTVVQRGEGRMVRTEFHSRSLFISLSS